MYQISNRAKAKMEGELKLAWYIALKENSPCVVCTEDFPSVIELHHKHPEEKVDTVINLVKRNLPFEEIVSEVHKCIPLCCTCHKKVHWGAIDIQYLSETRRKDNLIITFNSSVRDNLELTVSKDIGSLKRNPSIQTAFLRNTGQLDLF